MDIPKLRSAKSILAGMGFLTKFCWQHDKMYILLLSVKQLSSSALPPLRLQSSMATYSSLLVGAR